MELNKKIQEFIKEISSDTNILRHVYNGQDFVPGKTPVYYSGQYWDNEELSVAIENLLVGDWISAGENVRNFEHQFATRFNQRYGVMVNSGSSANLIAMAVLKKYYNWSDGDEIIVSPVGFATTISVIPQNNLIPVFVDIELDSLNFDVSLIEKNITNKTRAIFLSPVLGNPPDIYKINSLCYKYNLKLILDCCDSLGSKWRDYFLTEYAVISTHSFYASHTISTGEGGMIVTDNEEIADLCRMYSAWGRACTCSGKENLFPNGKCNARFAKWISGYNGIVDHKYVFDTMGYNLKPLDLQGAIGLVQLKKIDEILKNRNISKERITQIFIDNNLDVKTVKVLEDASPVWFATPFITKSFDYKNKLVRYLEANKIQTRNYFAGNILLHEGYKHLGNAKDYPNANEVLKRVFFVGASPHYKEDVFNYIEEVVKEFDYYE